MKPVSSTPHLVTEPALFGRVARALWRDEGCILRRCSERSRSRSDLGRYYATDGNNHMSHAHVELEKIAAELGVLRPGEQLTM